MVQDILTYLAIFFALSVIVYKAIRLFLPSKQKSEGSCCSSGGCHNCNLKEIDSGIRYHQIKHSSFTDPLVISKN